MPLSDHEQRLLDEIEQALYAEDPKFASSVRAARRRHPRIRTTAVLCVFGVLAGLGLVLVGLLANIIALSVIGFVLLVGACGYGVQSWRARRSHSAPPAGTTESRPSRSGGFRTRMEDRMRRRFDEG